MPREQVWTALGSLSQCLNTFVVNIFFPMSSLKLLWQGLVLFSLVCQWPGRTTHPLMAPEVVWGCITSREDDVSNTVRLTPSHTASSGTATWKQKRHDPTTLGLLALGRAPRLSCDSLLTTSVQKSCLKLPFNPSDLSIFLSWNGKCIFCSLSQCPNNLLRQWFVPSLRRGSGHFLEISLFYISLYQVIGESLFLSIWTPHNL